MFGLGFGEILLLAAIGLIVLGPKQLPQVAKVIGRTIGELKKALHDVTAQVAINLDEEHKKSQEKPAPPVTPAVVVHDGPVTPADVNPPKKENS